MAKCRYCGKDHCCSSPDVVNSLDKDQLRTLIELAQERIKKLDDEKKVILLSVGDKYVNHAFFREDEQQKAADFMVKHINEQLKLNLLIGSKIEIKKVRVNESEVNDYLNL